MKLDKGILVVGLVCWFIIAFIVSLVVALDVADREPTDAAIRIFGWTLASGALLFGVFAQTITATRLTKREEP